MGIDALGEQSRVIGWGHGMRASYEAKQTGAVQGQFHTPLTLVSAPYFKHSPVRVLFALHTHWPVYFSIFGNTSACCDDE